MYRRTALLTLILLIAACRTVDDSQLSSAPDLPTASAEPGVTQTHTPAPSQPFTAPSTSTATSAPTITPSPTPTFTPTPTAPPAQISGDPRAVLLADPIAGPNASCGFVDILDFPLGPPDGDGFRGGGDFGVFRSRYDKFHAGEDWWAADRGSSFGQPVYSIGHGEVTYAEPEGWKRDKGVVIIRHTFRDGSSVLSFYGHLDPPSVTLEAGDCVLRGQKIAEIGKPRGSPHLHFEIRTQQPFTPMTGYWPEDPTTIGWLPPSFVIWTNRLQAAGGVTWLRGPAQNGTVPVGLLDANNFMVVEEGGLFAIDPLSGGQARQLLPLENVNSAVIAPDHSVLYAGTRGGEIRAYQLPEPMLVNREAPASIEGSLLWSRDLDGFSAPYLMPLPGGGAAVVIRQTMTLLSSRGEVIWTHELNREVEDWAQVGSRLFFTTRGIEGTLWSIEGETLVNWTAEPLAGHLLAVGNKLWVASDTGLYRLDPDAETIDLLLPLDRSFLGLGDMIQTPGGDVLLTHRDRSDTRLMRFQADGTLLWERSLRGTVTDTPQLIEMDGTVYLLADNLNDSASQTSLYAVDLNSANLTLIFQGGTRTSLAGQSWALPAGQGKLLLNIGGGHLLALDAAQATEIAVQPTPP